MAQRLIVDTDYNTDVGDFGAMAVALTAHRLGWVNLIGVIVNTSYNKVPGAVCAQAEWWNVSGLSYGVWKGTAHESSAPSLNWPGYLYDNFSHTVRLASTVTDSTVAYRTMLAASPDGSVDIAAIGFLQCVSALLDSPADGISPLTGAELVAAKVRRLYVMGGQYPSGTEYNFKGGESPVAFICAAGANVCANWPTPIRFVGFELGTFATGGTFGRPTTDIVSAAYTQHGSTSGRTAWDEQCILAAVQQGTDFVEVRGTNAVNATTGANAWTLSAAGKDAYYTRDLSTSLLQAKINSMVGVTVASTPILPTWGIASTLRVSATS